MRQKKWIKSAWVNMVIGFLLLAQFVAAHEKGTAEEFLKSKLGAVFAILQKKELAQHHKNSQVDEIVTSMFDFPLMARLSLGRKYWSDLSQDHKQKFTELFIERLRQFYLNKLTTYTDEKIIYEPAVAVKKKVHVPTLLVSRGQKIPMLYKLYLLNNTWQIYDVEIQGVSIINTYRSQFRAILQNGTFEDLLQEMQKPVDN